MKLFLEQKETASSFHLRKKYYLQITWKSAETVRGVGDKRKNRYRFEVWVSYEYSHTLNDFKQVQIAYLAAISYLDKLVQPSYTLCTQIRPKATPRAC